MDTMLTATINVYEATVFNPCYYVDVCYYGAGAGAQHNQPDNTWPMVWVFGRSISVESVKLENINI